MSEIAVFGGWDTNNLTTSFALIKEKNAWKIDANRIKDLEKADIFLFTGGIRIDTAKSEIVICGQEYIHSYHEKDKTFHIVRQL